MHDLFPPPQRHRPSSLAKRLAVAERLRARGRRTREIGWRLATPGIFAAAGLLLITSGINAEGTDLRAGRYADLADLARQESKRVQELRAQVTDLNSEIDTLSGTVDNAALDGLNSSIDSLSGIAGVTATSGAGVVVTLDDAPADVLSSAGDDQVKDAIVHQQDIQAVVNAMWAGGADAVTIEGQRVISTTGIKCIGNTVRLQDVPYYPPYKIAAIGDPDRLEASIDASPYVQRYLSYVDAWELGWDLKREDLIEAPEYTGPLTLQYARAAPATQPDKQS